MFHRMISLLVRHAAFIDLCQDLIILRVDFLTAGGDECNPGSKLAMQMWEIMWICWLCHTYIYIYINNTL